MSEILLQTINLKKYFPVKRGVFFQKTIANLKAVDGISLDIQRGETLGLVGESGCGKSTLGRTIMRLYEPTSGTILFDNKDITTLPEHTFRSYRKNIQMIFQDPYASLNPRMTVESIIAEPLKTHRVGDHTERRKKVFELMDIVGLNPSYIRRYPHEFSGGQRQRIGIARALALNPKLIIADEPISSLDVSIQAQIINLLIELQIYYDLSYIFITHALSVVQHISTRVAVMYLGKIVELAPTHELFKQPLHPYTEALISAIPVPDPQREKERKTKRIILKGDIPSPLHPPQGCSFHTRCPKKFDRCEVEEPRLQQIGNTKVACHLY